MMGVAHIHVSLFDDQQKKMALGLRRPNAKTEGPPVFSQEFVIQNHADIISCLCVVIFLGLLPQATNEIASRFIFLQYNETITEEQPRIEPIVSSRIDTRPIPKTFYRHGRGDILNVFFYSLIWIIIHALIQEYVWERTVRRLRLSKNKTSKYLDSGMMLVFYFISLVMGIDHILKGNYILKYGLPLWEGYPHDLMVLSVKFYMLVQMGFWIHCFPEIYFLKMRKEDLSSKLILYACSLFIIAVGYVLFLQRLTVVLLVIHYMVEFIYQASCLLDYHGRNEMAKLGYKVWKLSFLLARVSTVAISVITLLFGIATNEEDSAPLLFGINLTSPVVRISCLVLIVLVQIFLLYSFFNQKQSSSGGGVANTEAPPITSNKKNKQASSPRQKNKNKKKEE